MISFTILLPLVYFLRNSPPISIFLFCEILLHNEYFFDNILVTNKENNLLNSNFQLKILIIYIKVIDGNWIMTHQIFLYFIQMVYI